MLPISRSSAQCRLLLSWCYIFISPPIGQWDCLSETPRPFCSMSPPERGFLWRSAGWRNPGSSRIFCRCNAPKSFGCRRSEARPMGWRLSCVLGWGPASGNTAARSLWARLPSSAIGGKWCKNLHGDEGENAAQTGIHPPQQWTGHQTKAATLRAVFVG